MPGPPSPGRAHVASKPTKRTRPTGRRDGNPEQAAHGQGRRPTRFVGDAWFDVIVRGEAPSRVRVSVVRFAPGARNAWHAHAGGPDDRTSPRAAVCIQARGGDILEIRAGDTVYTPPGEWHWHGAAPDHFMTHLAIVGGVGGRHRVRVGRPRDGRGVRADVTSRERQHVRAPLNRIVIGK